MTPDLDTDTAPTFPPLMWGEPAQDDALRHACQRATLGCDAGLVAYRITDRSVEGALVFAPEVPLADAVQMLPLCAVGFQNALGALAPPEVAVHLRWDGGILVNGAACGGMRMVASTPVPGALPDWLVVGFTLPLWPASDDPGTTPGQTALYAEGCADVAPVRLLESWARHSLHWISRWEDQGSKPLHAEWRGLAHGIGEPAVQNGLSGTYLGVDERFGMLLRDDTTTHLIPLTTLLEETP